MKNEAILLMRPRVCLLGAAILLTQIIQFSNSQAHEINVHRQITLHAVASVVEASANYNGFIETIGGSISLSINSGDNKTATEWMMEGSEREDDQLRDSGGVRSINHFYNPLNGMGLSDIPPIFGDGNVEYGRNSFDWASLFNSIGQVVVIPQINHVSSTQNEWSWQNAREFEWMGFTESDPVVRNRNLAKMFRALGNVVHLLEDASQPQHVRNEQHLSLWPSYKSPIEKYGAENCENLNYTHGMLKWRTAGFTKMKDFWDRDKYTGNASVLNADANGGEKLGLAEFSNGNFVGRTATYAEDLEPGDKHYFPYPSRLTSTDFLDARWRIIMNRAPITLRDGTVGQGVYLKKVGDGISSGFLHSRFLYLGVKHPAPNGPIARVENTINDDNVLQAYHSILIPKAVEYSAGLLDYFFRGRLGCISLGQVSPSQWVMNIPNGSDESFSGGSFTVVYEAANGTRTQVPGSPFPLVGTLPPGNTKTITLSEPLPSNSKYVVVYKGTIGLSGGNPSDPVDSAIAIAVQSSPSGGPDWSQIVWDAAGFIETGPGSSASGSASGNTVQFSLVGTPTRGASAFVQGHLNYTGAATCCKIRINVVESVNTYFDLRVAQDGNVALIVSETDLSIGQNEFVFPVAAGVDSVINVLGDWAGVGIMAITADETGGRLSLSFTLSNGPD